MPDEAVPDDAVGPPPLDAFEAPTERSPQEWRWLWEGDHTLALPRHPGWAGGLKLALKRLLRRFVAGAQFDLWRRQRLFNLFVVRAAESAEAAEGLATRGERRIDGLEGGQARLGADLQRVQEEMGRDLRTTRDDVMRDVNAVYDTLMGHLKEQTRFLESHHDRLTLLEKTMAGGLDDLRRHQDGLYARLDQKLDDYRSRSRDLWSELQALLSTVDVEGSPERVARAAQERDYLGLERRFRGDEAEIERRIEPYIEILSDRGPVLDLGCGRGEALEVLRRRGIACRGVDASAEMVARCREKGLDAAQGDLFEALRSAEAGALGGILSLHVIEHLPTESLEAVVKLAWRALRPGGVLALETPSPLSLVVAARNFWIDPTHRRPVHPDTLRHLFEGAGFDPVERIDLQPFAAEQRLPEISPAGLDGPLREVVVGVNRLRDELDALLFGFQDFGMVGYKPASRARRSTAASSRTAAVPSA